MQLPAPPVLKTTIIQLNKDIDPEDNNYEILTKEYSNNGTSTSLLTSLSLAIAEEQPRKKRRRSSSFVDDEELVRRRNETKQLHSIIEKRRRIKINREFEALKYLIPACRNTDNSSKNSATNNGSKIDGMYKLTILKSAVEYILYLHHIVQKQHGLLKHMLDAYNYDVAYSTIPLDVNQYRNIDKEFDFAKLASRASEMTTSSSSKSRCEPITEQEEEIHYQRPSTHQQARNFGLQEHHRAKSDTFAALGRSSQLPTPNVTPDIAPILSLLSKYSGDTQSLTAYEAQFKLGEPTRAKQGTEHQKSISEKTTAQSQESSLLHKAFLEHEGSQQAYQCQHDIDSLSKTFLFEASSHKTGSISSSTSPFTIPIKSVVKRSAFYLPDPALSASGSSTSSASDLPSTGAQALPKKMYFKSKIPPTNLVANVGLADSEVEVDEDVTEGERLEDASVALLTLRKPSIERLLN